MLVILAGYEKGPKNVPKMLRTNPGLSSRFVKTIRMQDMSGVACAGLLQLTLKHECGPPVFPRRRWHAVVCRCLPIHSP